MIVSKKCEARAFVFQRVVMVHPCRGAHPGELTEQYGSTTLCRDDETLVEVRAGVHNYDVVEPDPPAPLPEKTLDELVAEAEAREKEIQAAADVLSDETVEKLRYLLRRGMDRAEVARAAGLPEEVVSRVVNRPEPVKE